jgi:hypothetical protein
MRTIFLPRCSVRQLFFALVPLALLEFSSLAADKTQVFLNGKDLTGWRSPTGDWLVAYSVAVDSANTEKFSITPGQGVLVNGAAGNTVELLTEAEFGDVDVHIEFCIPKRSNSGVYLMGRYEIQVYDSYGVEKDKYPGIECGGIYPRWIKETNVEGHSPRVNVSKPPGEWQSFDITFRAPRFDMSGRKIENARIIKVVHNGKLIHENIALTGPTRATLWEDEQPRGPLRLQGNHGPVAYRNIRITPLQIK